MYKPFVTYSKPSILILWPQVVKDLKYFYKKLTFDICYTITQFFIFLKI